MGTYQFKADIDEEIIDECAIWYINDSRGPIFGKRAIFVFMMNVILIKKICVEIQIYVRLSLMQKGYVALGQQIWLRI